MVGRPREFNREEALGKAIRLFWEQGFEATGIAELSEHLGIGRQSLYGSFGDKRSLFLEALNNYCAEANGWFNSTLEAPGSALANIHTILDTWEANAKSKDYCGCLMTNTTSELGFRDPELARMLKRQMANMHKAFEKALTRARDDGEVSTDMDIQAMASMLVNTGQGISVTGKVDKQHAGQVVKAIKTMLG